MSCSFKTGYFPQMMHLSLVKWSAGEKVQSENQIYVSGLPRNLTEDDIANFFGSIGVIKTDKRTGKQKIWIYRDQASGDQKGEATVTYDDHAAAQSAISWFDGKGGTKFFSTALSSISALLEEIKLSWGKSSGILKENNLSISV